MNLFNNETGKQEYLPAREDIHNAVLSGKYSAPAGSKIRVYSPEGELGEIPADKLYDAVNAGYKVQTTVEKVVKDYTDKNKGLGSAVKVGLLQFGDELLGGIPELIYDKTASGLDVAKKEALKKEHDVANSIGGTLGFGAGLVAGGPIFKGAAKAGEAVTAKIAANLGTKLGEQVGPRTLKNIAKEIAARAGGTAAEGALLSTPRALTEASLGDPEAAGESMLYGVGLGALFGAGGPMLREFKRKGNEVLESSGARQQIERLLKEDTSLKAIAESKAVEALNPSLGQRERLRALEETALENGDVVLKPTENLRIIGKDLHDNDIIRGFSSKQDMYERLSTKTDQLKTEVGDTLQKFDDTFGDAARIKTADVINGIRQRIAGNEYFQTAAFKPFVQNVEGYLDRLAMSGETLTLRQANREKSAFQQIAKSAYTSPNGSMDITTANVLKEIPAELNKVIRSTAAALDPEAAKTLLEKQRLLGNLTQAEAIAKKSAAREAVNNDFGLNSFMSGGAGGVIGTMLGGAPGAIVGTLAGMMGREISRRYGDQIMSKAARSLDGLLFSEQAMKRAAIKLDKIPEILTNIQNRVPKSLPSGKTSSMEAIRRLITPEKDREEKANTNLDGRINTYFKMKDRLDEMVANPENTINRAAALASPLMQGGAPTIGGAFAGKVNNAVNYLHSQAPKPPSINPVFAPKIPWRPTGYDISQFEAKVAVVEDPFSVLDDLEAGTLTRSHVEALQAVYPALYTEMKNKIADVIYGNRTDIPYTQRLKLSLLMGNDLDSTVSQKQLAYYQNTFKQIEALQQQEAQGGATVDVAGQMMTSQDALVSRRLSG